MFSFAQDFADLLQHGTCGAVFPSRDKLDVFWKNGQPGRYVFMNWHILMVPYTINPGRIVNLHGYEIFFLSHAGFSPQSGFIFIASHQKMDLAELLYRAGQNNRIAQQQVYDFFAKKMFLVCRLYTKDDVTAEEILINGFLRFYLRLAGFRYINEYATHNFLKRIMVNECLRHLKRNRDLFIVASEELPEGEWPEEITAHISAKEIYSLIAKLPLGYRTVFNLVAMENKTHKEIAAALNISEKTSQSQYRRAKDMLQQMLIQMNKDYEYRRTTKYNKGKAQ